jgi:DNA-binding response OmpR family regulator
MEKAKAKILVVDDEEDILHATRHFLVKRGYEVLIAATKDEAMEMVKQSRPQIILLDIRLKEASGLDILKEAKAIDNNIKVIMVTALDDEENMKQAKAWGAEDYIAKPFTTAYLNEVLMQKLKALAFREKKEQAGK